MLGGGGGVKFYPHKKQKVSTFFFLVGGGGGGGGIFHFVAPPLPLINDRSLTTVFFSLSKTTAYFNGTMQNRVQ